MDAEVHSWLSRELLKGEFEGIACGCGGHGRRAHLHGRLGRRKRAAAFVRPGKPELITRAGVELDLGGDRAKVTLESTALLNWGSGGGTPINDAGQVAFTATWTTAASGMSGVFVTGASVIESGRFDLRIEVDDQLFVKQDERPTSEHRAVDVKVSNVGTDGALSVRIRFEVKNGEPIEVAVSPLAGLMLALRKSRRASRGGEDEPKRS